MSKKKVKPNKGMLALQAAAKLRKEQGIALVYKNPEEKLKGKPTSLRLSVNAMCYQCMGNGHDAGWKWGIGNCTSPDCGLYAVRPYQKLEGKPAVGVYVTGKDGE